MWIFISGNLNFSLSKQLASLVELVHWFFRKGQISEKVYGQTDGQKVIRKGHLNLQFKWAKIKVPCTYVLCHFIGLLKFWYFLKFLSFGVLLKRRGSGQLVNSRTNHPHCLSTTQLIAMTTHPHCLSTIQLIHTVCRQHNSSSWQLIQTSCQQHNSSSWQLTDT